METSEQQRRPTIGQLRTQLNRYGLDLSALDLADIFWLAQFIEPGAGVQVDTTSKTPNTDTKTNTPKITKTSNTEEPTFELFSDNLPVPESNADQKDSSTEKPKRMPFPAPAAPALRTRLDLARSLKPLMRKVPSRLRFDLDEEETVTQIVETGVWMPIERPIPERWLDLDLVVEGSKTTVLWERAICELQHLTEYQGAFRTVRTWRLQAQTGKVKIFPRWNTQTQKGKQQKSQRPRNPKELLDPSGRRLILFVTDCTSALWRQGMVHETLWLW
ncbi:MAG: hypothetical protein F6J89_13505 [Symploca sp. SIO1C4]|uniref:Formylglycine-generating enzyme family protein n=1 Tax=Symploca sp. SIO1C4 TaxID=2607765 RepID=A0A6B3NG46_9CYAN|nr:hypothetical protein [Symploca sp. SIO1C4]